MKKSAKLPKKREKEIKLSTTNKTYHLVKLLHRVHGDRSDSELAEKAYMSLALQDLTNDPDKLRKKLGDKDYKQFIEATLALMEQQHAGLMRDAASLGLNTIKSLGWRFTKRPISSAYKESATKH